MYNQVVLLCFCGVMVLTSIIAFVLYGKDKSLAKRGRPRIKEKILLGIAVIGGALGALIGRIVFRHKTDKIYFSMVIIFSLLLEIVALVLLIVGVLK